jgi:hypothetical protein
MASETLYEKLNYTKAYRKTRQDVADWVIARPQYIGELLEYCFNIKEPVSYKAAWILEFVCIEKLELLYEHLDYFFANLPKVNRDQALRPLAKVCKMITEAYYKKKDEILLKVLKPEHKQVMTELCFDWLITNQKVACEVYAMDTLYYLGMEIDWIHSELKTIIETNIHQKSPGYKAHGKQILALIKKYRYN